MKTTILTLAVFLFVFLCSYGISSASEIDSCKLLMDTKPSEVLGGPVDKPSKISVQCGVSLKADYLKSVSLALPSVSKANIGMTKEKLFSLQKQGFEMMGIRQDDLHEVDGLGDLTVYADHDYGMQLWVFWGKGYSAIVNLNGVKADKGLGWAKGLAQSVIDAGLPLE